jgi:hypothetical protein
MCYETLPASRSGVEFTERPFPCQEYRVLSPTLQAPTQPQSCLPSLLESVVSADLFSEMIGFQLQLIMLRL